MTDDADLMQTVAQSLERLEADERDAEAWRTLGACQERLKAWPDAVNCYWAAVRLAPERTDWLADLQRAADQAGDPSLIEALLRNYIEMAPAIEAGPLILAGLLRERRRPGEAIAVLREAVARIPTPATLLGRLAAILGEQGLMDEALEAVEAALSLAPGWPAGLQNRANIRLALGDIDGALADGAAAIAATRGREQASIRLARALALLRAGRLEEGWRDYGVRLQPDYVGFMRFDLPLPRWTPDQPLAGTRLLLVGEQGLGDEIMFANAIPEVLQQTARLGLAVILRLVPLFARSFPSAEVTYHYTSVTESGAQRSVPGIDLSGYDAYAPMGEIMQVLRRTVADFPDRAGYLTPDPERIAHWRRSLPPGRCIGLTWKSRGGLQARSRFYAPFELWRPLFEQPGVTVVNLQYGDIAEETALTAARNHPLWLPPGLDVENDLDDLAALAAALDGVAGPLNSAIYLSGAAGARVAAVSVAEAWPGFGTGTLPWFPGSLLASPQRPGAWREAVDQAIAFLSPGTPS
jgi:tetratricopeptide (TPR) repeat protein